MKWHHFHRGVDSLNMVFFFFQSIYTKINLLSNICHCHIQALWVRLRFFKS